MSAERPVFGVGTYGVTTTPGTRFMMNSAATVAFGFPTSLGLGAQGNILVKPRFPNTRMSDTPEQELSIQVADVNGVHIDDMNVFEPR